MFGGIFEFELFFLLLRRDDKIDVGKFSLLCFRSTVLCDLKVLHRENVKNRLVYRDKVKKGNLSGHKVLRARTFLR